MTQNESQLKVNLLYQLKLHICTLEGGIREFRGFKLGLFIDIELGNFASKQVSLGNFDFFMHFLTSMSEKQSLDLEPRTSLIAPPNVSFQKTSHLNYHTHLLFFVYKPYHNRLQKPFHPFVHLYYLVCTPCTMFFITWSVKRGI